MKTFGKGKKTMKILKKIGLFLLDFIEVFMPVAALTITFVSFIANVIARYIVGSPLNASYELCLTGLLWCLLLSAPYAVRKDNNVKFTLVYDRLNGAGQMAFRLLGKRVYDILLRNYAVSLRRLGDVYGPEIYGGTPYSHAHYLFSFYRFQCAGSWASDL